MGVTLDDIVVHKAVIRYNSPPIPSTRPRVQTTAETPTTAHRYQPRKRCACGNAVTASATNRPITNGNRKALRTWLAIFSQTRSGTSHTSAARSDHACGVDAVEPRGVERVAFQRAAVSGHLSRAPGQGEGRYDGRHHRGAEDADTENQAAEIGAEDRRQCLADLTDAAQRSLWSFGPQSCPTATSTAAVNSWVRTAPQAVSHRAAA
jgi:hypothetical protein